jgi:hypothetical protein
VILRNEEHDHQDMHSDLELRNGFSPTSLLAFGNPDVGTAVVNDPAKTDFSIPSSAHISMKYFSTFYISYWSGI